MGWPVATLQAGHLAFLWDAGSVVAAIEALAIRLNAAG